MTSPRRQRVTVFIFTCVAYAVYYLCRKPWTVSKHVVQGELHLSLDTLALFDTLYLVAYAAGQFTSGLLCDHIGARRLLGVGMLLVGLSTALLGASHFPVAFAVAFSFNGLVQATGWPGTVKAMAVAFPPKGRGTVMGLWGTCYQFGSFVAGTVATYLLVHFGRHASFFAPAAISAAVGVAVLLLLSDAREPAEVNRVGRVASMAVLREPLLWSLCAVYFVLKLIRYCIIFWLPYLLHEQYGYNIAMAGYLSSAFDLGGTSSALVGGVFYDRLGRRRGLLLLGMSFGFAATSFIYPHFAVVGPLTSFGLLMLLGFMLLGPDTLVSSTAAQDLRGANGAGTAAGFINGFGSAGAIAQAVVTTYVVNHYGWDALFRFFSYLGLLAALLLLPYAVNPERRRDESRRKIVEAGAPRG